MVTDRVDPSGHLIGIDMRLSIVLFSLSGGAGVVARNLSLYAEQKGVTNNILCASSDPHLAAPLEGRVMVLKGRRLVRFALRVLINHRLLAHRVIIFDPLLAGLLTPLLQVLPQRRKIAIRILTNPTQIIQQTHMRLVRFAKRRVFRCGRRYADLLIANSKGSLKSFIQECPTAEMLPSEVIYNPVTSLDRHVIIEGATFTARLDVTGPVRIIAAAGRLVDQKGFDLLIMAIARLVCQGFSGFRVVIFGEGPKRNELERLIQENGLEHVIILYGSVPDLGAYLPVCDMFVLSSRYEGFGNVLVEALDAGLPVVAFDCPSGPSEILCGGKYGELLTTGSIRQLVNSLGSWLLAEPENYTVRQRERAKDFRVDIVGAKYLQVLEKM